MISSHIISMLLVMAMPQSQFVLEIDCQACHDPDHWKPLSVNRAFDHNETSFPLDGQHMLADCIQCHRGNTTEEFHRFDRAGSACASCHMDIHFEEFSQRCEKCHSTTNWDFLSWRFKHDETLFPLVGAHSIIGCNECHGDKESLRILNRSSECIDCHRDVYLAEVASSGHTENEDCYLCHNTRSWFPSDMSHHDIFFPIYSGSHKGEWTTCEAECHVTPNDYKEFSCGLNGVCHDHDKSIMDSQHDEESGYKYNSQSCYKCHPDGRED